MKNMRWIVGVGAFVLALAALYLLLRTGEIPELDSTRRKVEPALDDIDAKSRAAMRELLRDAGEE